MTARLETRRAARTSFFRSHQSVDHRAWLSLIVKERHDVLGRARLVEPRPLEPLRTRRNDETGLLEETDLTAAVKPHCDVFVSGHAYNPFGAASVTTLVEVGALRRRVTAHGERDVIVSGTGVSFGRAEPFDRVPITRDRAYGGVLELSPRRGGFGARMRADVSRVQRCFYPRNRSGVGFTDVSSLERLHGEPAPCLEDPDDPITPERLLLERIEDWPSAPLAAHYGPVDVWEFPRAQFFRAYELTDPCATLEVRRGALSLREDGTTEALGDPLGAQAAQPGLFGRVDAGMTVRTEHLFPGGGEARFTVPEGPRVAVLELPGCGPQEVALARKTLHLRPDEASVEITYAGTIEVGACYPEEMHAQIGVALRG